MARSRLGVVAGRAHQRERVVGAPGPDLLDRAHGCAGGQHRGGVRCRPTSWCRDRAASSLPASARMRTVVSRAVHGLDLRRRWRGAGDGFACRRSGARRDRPATAASRAGDSGCPGPGSWCEKRASVMIKWASVMMLQGVGVRPAPGRTRSRRRLPRASLTVDLAAVVADNLANEGQPEAGPFLVSGEERREDLLAQRRRNARTGVAHLDRAPGRRSCGWPAPPAVASHWRPVRWRPRPRRCAPGSAARGAAGPASARTVAARPARHDDLRISAARYPASSRTSSSSGRSGTSSSSSGAAGGRSRGTR